MNLIIDIGNTRTKFAIFKGNTELFSDASDKCTFDTIVALKQRFPDLTKTIISATGDIPVGLIEKCNGIFTKTLKFTHNTPVPFKVQYKTPETLGLDRLAGVAGAQFLNPGKNILSIDLGTAITYDIITSDNIYKGGNISPGMRMRFKALHQFTHKLPLLNADENSSLIGNSTQQAINNGVINGIRYEIEGIINSLEKNYQNLLIILTGGDAVFFEIKLKKTIFVVPNLVRIGLNTLLNYNAEDN